MIQNAKKTSNTRRFLDVTKPKKFFKMKRKPNKSTHSDGSSGEKMSEKPTLPKKGIKTYYGEMSDTEEAKKENYIEVCQTEDRRITNAEIAFHGRLSEKERECAWKWVSYFTSLVQGLASR